MSLQEPRLDGHLEAPLLRDYAQRLAWGRVGVVCGNREIVKVKISRIEVVHPDSGNFLMDLLEKISLLFDFSAIQREVWQPRTHPLCVFLIPVKYFHCGGLFS